MTATQHGITECVFTFDYPAGCQDDVAKIEGVHVHGEQAVPGHVDLDNPDACGGIADVNNVPVTAAGGEWDASYGDQIACPEDFDEADHGYALECNSAYQAQGEWTATLPLPHSGDCADYGWLTMEFVSPPCPQAPNAADAAMAACTAQLDADITLGHWRWGDRDGDGYQHSVLIPILEDGVDFTERAWIRKIEVVDWGDATALHVMHLGKGLELNGDSVVTGAGVETFTPATDNKTFAAGVLHMGTIFAIDGVDASASHQAPKLKMSWSCEVKGSNPHFEVLELPTGYGRRANTLGFGVPHDQRIIFRIYEDDSFARLELQGRHHDGVYVPLTKSGTNWTFDFHWDPWKLHATGSIAPFVGGHKVVNFTKLEANGLDLGTPSWVFVKEPE